MAGWPGSVAACSAGEAHGTARKPAAKKVRGVMPACMHSAAFGEGGRQPACMVPEELAAGWEGAEVGMTFMADAVSTAYSHCWCSSHGVQLLSTRKLDNTDIIKLVSLYLGMF